MLMVPDADFIVPVDDVSLSPDVMHLAATREPPRNRATARAASFARRCFLIWSFNSRRFSPNPKMRRADNYGRSNYSDRLYRRWRHCAPAALARTPKDFGGRARRGGEPAYVIR